MKDIPDDKTLDKIFEAVSSEDSLAAHISNPHDVFNTPEAPNFLDHLRQLWGLPEGTVFGEFKPCATYYPAMDMLLYLEEDCSYTSVWIKGSNIELLLHNYDKMRIVGVKICQFSQVAPPEVISAYNAAYSDEGSKGAKKRGRKSKK
jgi:hypothetical protein